MTAWLKVNGVRMTIKCARFVVIQIRSGPVQFQPYIPSGTFYSHPDPMQFQPSTQSGTFCCHLDRIRPSSVSTLHSIGHILLSSRPHSVSTKHSVGPVLLSSRYDLAQSSSDHTFYRAHFILIQTPFSFNQALSRARFVVIQIRSGPVQFQPLSASQPLTGTVRT